MSGFGRANPVIDEQGGPAWSDATVRAVRMARERGLDLVEISPTAESAGLQDSPTTANSFTSKTNKRISSARVVVARSSRK